MTKSLGTQRNQETPMLTDEHNTKGVFRGGKACPHDHTLIAGKQFDVCYTGDLQLLVRTLVTTNVTHLRRL